MSERSKTPFSRVTAGITSVGLVSLLRTRTIIALILLLLMLVAGIQLARPGTVNGAQETETLTYSVGSDGSVLGLTAVQITVNGTTLTFTPT